MSYTPRCPIILVTWKLAWSNNSNMNELCNPLLGNIHGYFQSTLSEGILKWLYNSRSIQGLQKQRQSWLRRAHVETRSYVSNNYHLVCHWTNINPKPWGSIAVFQLQQEAPKCHAVLCPYPIEGCPPYYGREYHGAISHKKAAALLQNEGDYLIRLSPNSDNFYTLSLR